MINEWPLLIGDLMLSNTSPAGGDIVLPTTGVTQIEPSAEWVPTGLCQKIALIGDHILIGWSGRLVVAEDVIGELNLRLGTEPLDMRGLNEYFDRQQSSVWKELGIVGFVREPEIQTAAFSRSASSATSPAIGEVRFIGSGTNALAKFIEANATIPTHPTVELNPANRAVLLGFTLAGGFMNIEIHTGENLPDVYGGGYEIATMSGGKFVKVDDVTYVYWRARYVSDTEIYLTDTPKRAFRYSYNNDLLVIRSWVPISSVAFAETLYPIRPVYRSLTAEERDNPPVADMNATWLCNFIVVESEGKPPSLHTLIMYRPNPTTSVHFFEYQGQHVFSVEESFLTNVLDAIRENSTSTTK
jgi:hypothetical protein